MTKYCPSCGTVKDSSAFWANARRADGLQSVCKRCHYTKYNTKKDRDKAKQAGRKYQKSEHGRNKAYEYAIKRKYGLSADKYAAMLNAQDHACAVCGRHGETYRKLCVDHDHETGVVRGLLCDRCNKALGLVKDEVILLTKLAEYLNRS
jgi:hypothetical protein